MVKYLTCLRPLNLVIVFATQILFYFTFFSPFLQRTAWNLTDWIFQFAMVTVLIAAGGYLINDYFDADSDLANSKKDKLTRNENLVYYVLLVFVGFCLALWIAWSLGNVLLVLIYMLAVMCLYLYSAKWKKEVLIGNVVVAGFTAGVPMIFLVAEKEHLYFLGWQQMNSIVVPIVLFSVFAFLINLVREIIKDIEDEEGDGAAGYETLPIKYGVVRARLFAAFFAILLLCILVTYCWYEWAEMDWPAFVTLVFCLIPLLYLIFSLLSSSDFDAGLLSKLCKGIMVMGLVWVLLL